MFARQNSAEEVNPWAIMSNIAPVSPQCVWIRVAEITRPMWPTDEYAMRAFRSGWRSPIRLVIMIPHSAKSINGYISVVLGGGQIGRIRMIPYPPSFSRMAARIMEPGIGASTWAFGNQRCTPYRGILTINASMMANQIIF